MPYSTDELFNIGIGLFAVIGSGFLVVKKLRNREKINQLQTFYNESTKCNLNHMSIKKQKQYAKENQKYFIHRPVSIEKVTAHFTGNNLPHVDFISDKYDDFPRIQCQPFYIVEKSLNPDSYQLYKVNVNNTLASYKILMPDVENHSTNKSVKKILTSAATLGIVGTLSLSQDASSYTIDAKIIGINLRQIEKYISDEILYNTFALIVSGAFMIGGLAWSIKTYWDIKKSRVPLEASLLDSKIRW